MIPAFLLNIYIVTSARKLGPHTFPAIHCQLLATNAQGWTMACALFQLESCELKHRRAGMLHSMAACAPPPFPQPPVHPTLSLLSFTMKGWDLFRLRTIYCSDKSVLEAARL